MDLRKRVIQTFTIPSSLDLSFLPYYINSDEKWNMTIKKSWNPFKWSNLMIKIWNDRNIKTEIRTEIIQLLLIDMEMLYGWDHVDTHKTIFELLKNGFGWDLFKDGFHMYGWGTGCGQFANLTPYCGNSNCSS